MLHGPADQTEMGPWETTGFVSDLDWAEVGMEVEDWRAMLKLKLK